MNDILNYLIGLYTALASSLNKGVTSFSNFLAAESVLFVVLPPTNGPFTVLYPQMLRNSLHAYNTLFLLSKLL